MKQYIDLLRHAMNGLPRTDRTGVGTISRFAHMAEYDLSKGFPLVTTKNVHFKSVVAELLWFLSGSTNVHDLQAMGCTIWDEWANEEGSLGPVYGEQWRNWQDCEGNHIDQIQQLVDDLKKDPYSRRHIVSAWNVGDLPYMALSPCHAMFQCYCTPLHTHQRIAAYKDAGGNDHQGIRMPEMDAFLDSKGVPKFALDLMMVQRSCDLFLGVPFNTASYSLLMYMLAQQCNMVPGRFVHVLGDLHIYSNHMDQVHLQLSREPRPLPKLLIKRKPASIFDYQPDDFELVGYDPHPAIKASVAV